MFFCAVCLSRGKRLGWDCMCNGIRPDDAVEGAEGVGSQPGGVYPLTEACCDCVEPVLAVKKNYRNVGKRERQEELFPQLQKEIAAKRVEL